MAREVKWTSLFWYHPMASRGKLWRQWNVTVEQQYYDKETERGREGEGRKRKRGKDSKEWVIIQ